MCGMSEPHVQSFANHVLGDWDDAMFKFMSAVERKQRARGLTDAEVRTALVIGYGPDVAEQWDEWVRGE